jgi:hypothetical protein
MEQGTRAKLIASYKEGTRVFAEALEGITDGELDARPGPDEWTAREVVHHMADSEMTATKGSGRGVGRTRRAAPMAWRRGWRSMPTMPTTTRIRSVGPGVR